MKVRASAVSIAGLSGLWGAVLAVLLAALTLNAAEPAAPTMGASAATSAGASPAERARELVAGAIDLTRGASSYTEMTMEVHRPDWQKTNSMVAWTRGREDALIRFTAPVKDAGNGTLKMGREMWTFTPKLNRVVRLPASLMSQSWAGSDFSYNDLSRSDDLLVEYDLALLEERERDGHKIYVIEAIPHADAPVVWGKQVMTLRDDYVMLEVTYYDQDMKPLKRMTATNVTQLGGRTIATRMRMVDLEEDDHYTELSYQAADFNAKVDDSKFTQFALRNAG